MYYLTPTNVEISTFIKVFYLEKYLKICYNITMKALSIYAPFAMAIALKYKTIELRNWQTSYRGEILICSSVKDRNNKELKDICIFGKALAIATISDCKPFEEKDREAAYIVDDEDVSKSNSWFLTNIKPIKPFDVKGQQRLFNVDVDEITILDIDDEYYDDILLEYYLENNLIKEI